MKNKENGELMGFIIGEIHAPNVMCQPYHFFKFMYGTDYIITESNIKSEVKKRKLYETAMQKKYALGILSNYVRFNIPEKKKFFLETPTQSKNDNELVNYYMKKSLAFETKAGMFDIDYYIGKINNPLEYFYLIHDRGIREEIKALWVEGVKQFKLGKVHIFNENNSKIANIFIFLGINEYFVEKENMNVIEYAKDKKPENTMYGRLVERNKLWYRRFKTILGKNEGETFLMVVGIGNLFLEGHGIIELLKHDYIIEKVENRPYKKQQVFIDPGEFEYSPDRPQNSNLFSYQDIEV